ncbi:TetR/AcrR family transcriptional regulator [Clostridium beijerinckii]|uniref:Division inhibitor protein n=1 Tax=Clostridium beijerinckii TaxID=1520 RepID=A0A1S8RV19_CLOBE|nr:TetR-like C-terminal domain-containing protein [Clostridium beijerinckii]NRY64101.1 AcrR family transcriptional regulator [Clostridium beijerinckii]OOM57063.1 division inhibitor protein [Clostridium beijerinckii]
MEQNKVDRRIRRTKKVLIEALTKLMSEKKINKITVKELTALADVNRSTFYLYYNDIYDMLEKIETGLFNDFIEAYDKFSEETASYDNLLSFLTYLLEFIKTNADMFKILLGHDGDYAFIEKFKNFIKYANLPVNSSFSNTKAHYYIPYTISGFIGVVQQWLNDDMNVPPKDLAAIIIEMF